MLRTALALLATVPMIAPAPAFAGDRFTAAVGGQGGGQYQLRCPAGTLLTGVTGRVGAWFFRVGPVCDGQVRGSTGGQEGRDNRADCPQGSVVQNIFVRTLRSDNHYLDSLQLKCVDRNNRGQVTAQLSFLTPEGGGSGNPIVTDTVTDVLAGPLVLVLPGKDRPLTGLLGCGNDEIVGVQGNSGASIDSFGLICGTITTTTPTSYAPGAARNCKVGYVWRGAWNGDAVCVTPAIRTQAAQDNAAAAARSITGQVGGNCVNGYVWRVARSSDLVCVTPATRSQTAADNAAAGSRVQ